MPGISERKKKMAVLYSFCLYSNPFCLVLSTDDDSCHAEWVTSNVGYSPRDRRGSSRHRSKAVSFLPFRELSFVNNRTTNVWNPVSNLFFSFRDSSFNLLLSLCKPWAYYIFIYFAFFLGFFKRCSKSLVCFLLSLFLPIFNGRSFYLAHGIRGKERRGIIRFFSRSTKLSTDRLRN